MSFSFGLPSAGSPAPATGFGATTPMNKQIGFGSSTPTLGLGAANQTLTNFSFNTSIQGASAPASSTATGFSFSTPASSAPNSQPTFGLGSTLASNSTSVAPTTTLSVPNAGGAGLTTTNVGLGGVSLTTDGVAGPVSTYPYSSKDRLKQNTLPKEILSTVDSFKEFVKKQKALGSELMRISPNSLHKVTADRAALASEVASATIDINGVRAAARRLRENASKTLQSAERAVGAYEYDLPPQLLMQVIGDLEHQFISLRQQLDTVQTHLKQPSKILNQKELNQGITRIFNSLVALAGRLQVAHTQVLNLKERHLKLRRRLLNDTTDVFRKDPNSMEKFLSKKASKPASAHSSNDEKTNMAGPTPFTYVGNSFFALKPLETNSWGQQHQKTS